MSIQEELERSNIKGNAITAYLFNTLKEMYKLVPEDKKQQGMALLEQGFKVAQDSSYIDYPKEDVNEIIENLGFEIEVDNSQKTM